MRHSASIAQKDSSIMTRFVLRHIAPREHEGAVAPEPTGGGGGMVLKTKQFVLPMFRIAKNG
jgi:hypothetical protein